MGATLITVDVLDFFPHPAMIDINDDLPVIHRFRISPEQLVEKAKSGDFDIDAALQVLEIAENGASPPPGIDITEDALKARKTRSEERQLQFG